MGRAVAGRQDAPVGLQKPIGLTLGHFVRHAVCLRDPDAVERGVDLLLEGLVHGLVGLVRQRFGLCLRHAGHEAIWKGNVCVGGIRAAVQSRKDHGPLPTRLANRLQGLPGEMRQQRATGPQIGRLARRRDERLHGTEGKKKQRLPARGRLRGGTAHELPSAGRSETESNLSSRTNVPSIR